MPSRTRGTRFEIAGNRANLGHRGARIKSELDAHVAETASQIMERGASHPHRAARRIFTID
jgi:hypothetical protein